MKKIIILALPALCAGAILAAGCTSARTSGTGTAHPGVTDTTATVLPATISAKPHMAMPGNLSALA
jgi:hypothetical protein